MCKQIDHFPEDTNYEADPSEYFLRESRLLFYIHSFQSSVLEEQLYFSLKSA